MVNQQLQHPPALVVSCHTRPSGRTLALAGAVVKSKPTKSSIEDFLLQIQEFVQRREKASGDRKRCLHSAAFWHQAYEKSEAVQSNLLDKVYELEQRLDASNSSNARGAIVARKRDRLDANLPLENKVNKQRKATGGAGRDSSTAQRSTLVNNDEPETCDATTSVLRQLYHLRKLLAEERPGSEALALACISLCKATSSAISASLSDSTEGTPGANRRPLSLRISVGGRSLTGGRDSLDLTTVFTVVEGECYAIVLQGLKKLGELDGGLKNQSKVIHGLITLFQEVLAQLHAIFLSHSKELVEAGNEPRNRTATARSGNQGSEKTRIMDKAAKALDLHVPNAVSHLLCAMILSLDATRPESSNLLEGYLGCLLNQIGNRLCFIVFGEENIRPESILTRGTLQAPTEGLRDHPQNEVKKMAIKGEAEYLTKVLTQALHFASARQNLLSEELERRDYAEDPQPTLHTLLKSRLQNTLLKGVFGDVAIFKDRLRTSHVEMSDPDVEGAKMMEDPEEEPGSRFIREIWELVGWDILEGAIGFAEEDEEL